MEAACLLGRDLRPGDSGLPALASAAADALINEGMHALGRNDLPGAATLLERARQLLPAGDARHTSVALYLAMRAFPCGTSADRWPRCPRPRPRSPAAAAAASRARSSARS